MRDARERLSEQGASSVEYAILVSLIAIFILAAVALMGGNLADSFHRSCDSVAATQSETCP